jgi:hypothetical protein
MEGDFSRASFYTSHSGYKLPNETGEISLMLLVEPDHLFLVKEKLALAFRARRRAKEEEETTAKTTRTMRHT